MLSGPVDAAQWQESLPVFATALLNVGVLAAVVWLARRLVDQLRTAR